MLYVKFKTAEAIIWKPWTQCSWN